jgi:hypothetical protein
MASSATAPAVIAPPIAAVNVSAPTTTTAAPVFTAAATAPITFTRVADVPAGQETYNELEPLTASQLALLYHNPLLVVRIGESGLFLLGMLTFFVCYL